ncbi:hypothetical protein I7I53_08137 [Histoplasma capsulatum var. duboisii H88]|uniref:Uncharacterized protein n=1 Tax=Ajellomyces capsulatus (strain H88) TaxID=544711 RepID=A0A8A1LHU0_AJEC8|nr:hypothetical protein I7I53_08137 [Histoplasma capsulatum var. duboisii H88]
MLSSKASRLMSSAKYETGILNDSNCCKRQAGFRMSLPPRLVYILSSGNRILWGDFMLAKYLPRAHIYDGAP